MKKMICFIILLFSLDSQPGTYAQAGEFIVFTSDQDGNREIYTMTPDGTLQQRLTHNTAEDRDPTWSPDRRHIAFVSNRNGTTSLFLMNADGSNQHPISPDDGAYYDSPTWSPDGQQLAFVSDREGGLNLFLMPLDGSQVRPLTHDSREVENLEPDWSPDGRSLAFASNREQYFHIYTLPVTGGAPQRLTAGSQGDHYSPAWSPDGQSIAYALNGNGFSELYVMAANGATPRLVMAAEGYFAGAITWSPDGQTLAYVVWKNGEPRSIRTVHLDGTNVQQLTNSAFDADYPHWHSPSPIAPVIIECPGLLPPRLLAGDIAYVIPGMGGGNSLNSQPSRPSLDPHSQRLALIPENGQFTVIEGPVCGNNDGIVWWKVNYNGIIGWTGESGDNGYWLEKVP